MFAWGTVLSQPLLPLSSPDFWLCASWRTLCLYPAASQELLLQPQSQEKGENQLQKPFVLKLGKEGETSRTEPSQGGAGESGAVWKKVPLCESPLKQEPLGCCRAALQGAGRLREA